jgi:hypothetical protein
MKMLCIFFIFLSSLARASYETDTVKIRGNQSIAGNKTFTGNINLSALTGNCVLRSDGSDNLTCGGFDIDNSGNLTGVDGIFSGSVNANLILEMVSTTKASKPCPEMTTAQRDALTPVNGSCIYNSTTLSYQFYNGTSWGDVGGGVSATQANDSWVAFAARSTNGQNCFATTAQRVEFETEDYDTHNAYDPATGTFTVPSGVAWCYFNASLLSAAYAAGAGDVFVTELYINGAASRRFARREVDGTNTVTSDTIGSAVFRAVTGGEAYDIRGVNTALTVACATTGGYNYFGAICYKSL